MNQIRCPVKRHPITPRAYLASVQSLFLENPIPAQDIPTNPVTPTTEEQCYVALLLNPVYQHQLALDFHNPVLNSKMYIDTFFRPWPMKPRFTHHTSNDNLERM